MLSERIATHVDEDRGGVEISSVRLRTAASRSRDLPVCVPWASQMHYCLSGTFEPQLDCGIGRAD
jgi:hypothetical protein